MIKTDNNREMSNIKYADIQKHLKDRGYTLERICIDESSEIVNTFSLAKGIIGPVLDIRCPSRYKIFILGRNQLSENTNSKMLSADINTAHAFKVMFKDSNNDEIAPDNRIRIKRVKPSQEIIMVATMFYKDITITDYQKEPPHKIKSDDKCDITAKAVYRFNQSILINGGEHLQIEAVNPDIAIDAKNIRLSLDIDFWEEE